MTDEKTYIPISCTRHSELELAIMHKQWLRIAWQEGNVDHVASLLPLDIQARDGAEFLVAESQNGERQRLRLDYLRSIQAVDYD